MANKAKIERDELGLYVNAGGSISRPFFGTMFKEGDSVKAHHFGGSTSAGVTFDGDSSKFLTFRNGKYEHWCTTGISNSKYKEKTAAEISSKTEWYRNDVSSYGFIYKEHNEEFKKEFQHLI